jgi:probable phosphoglycerate mutase
MVIEDDQGMRLWGGHRYAGVMTNNRAEYEALIDGLRKAAEWKPDRLEVYMDSLLVVQQVNGRWKVRNPDLGPLHRQAVQLLRSFRRANLSHVPRERNRGADSLANRAIDEGGPTRPLAR